MSVCARGHACIGRRFPQRCRLVLLAIFQWLCMTCELLMMWMHSFLHWSASVQTATLLHFSIAPPPNCLPFFKSPRRAGWKTTSSSWTARVQSMVVYVCMLIILFEYCQILCYPNHDSTLLNGPDYCYLFIFFINYWFMVMFMLTSVSWNFGLILCFIFDWQCKGLFHVV